MVWIHACECRKLRGDRIRRNFSDARVRDFVVIAVGDDGVYSLLDVGGGTCVLLIVGCVKCGAPIAGGVAYRTLKRTDLEKSAAEPPRKQSL